MLTAMGNDSSLRPMIANSISFAGQRRDSAKSLSFSLALNTGKVTRESQTVADSRTQRAPVMFLQIATKFATVRNVLSPSQPIRLAAEDKLAALRRLDKS